VIGLHGYAVSGRNPAFGKFVFNAGEWHAKLGDQPLHGYYTAIIVRDGGQAKIMEETVIVAAPGR
jgi:hypothetical protein